MLMRLPLRGGRWSQAMAPYETRSVTNQRTLFEREPEYGECEHQRIRAKCPRSPSFQYIKGISD